MKQLLTERKAPTCYMTDKEKIEKATALITELIDVARIKDEEHKQKCIAQGNAEGAVGESYDIFYLKMVRDILEGKQH